MIFCKAGVISISGVICALDVGGGFGLISSLPDQLVRLRLLEAGKVAADDGICAESLPVERLIADRAKPLAVPC